MARDTLPRIAVIDDEAMMIRFIRSALETEKVLVDGYPGSNAFLEQADLGAYDMIFCDLTLQGLSGIDLLRKLRGDGVESRFVIMTGHACVATAVQAMKEGAHDYLVKPFPIQELVDLVHRTIASAGSEGPRHETELEFAIGSSPAWKTLLQKAHRVAEMDSVVLIRGESGSGKEVLARYIASFGPRAGKPLVTVNCAALPDALVESELFGHVRGAFSGATAARRGLFEEASHGTLFLDEIGTMPLAAQAKLLRALEERSIRRVGDNRMIPVDVRLIAATNLDVEAAIARREFRQDLYYRLAVVTLRIPPLRERREDLPLLIDHFLSSFTPRGGKPKVLSPDALKLMQKYSFPGNVRELKHAIEQAVAFAHGRELTPEDFLDLGTESETPAGAPEDVTAEQLEDALRRSDGNRGEAAKVLGISRSSLYRLLRRHGHQQHG